MDQVKVKVKVFTWTQSGENIFQIRQWLTLWTLHWRQSPKRGQAGKLARFLRKADFGRLGARSI